MPGMQLPFLNYLLFPKATTVFRNHKQNWQTSWHIFIIQSLAVAFIKRLSDSNMNQFDKMVASLLFFSIFHFDFFRRNAYFLFVFQIHGFTNDNLWNIFQTSCYPLKTSLCHNDSHFYLFLMAFTYLVTERGSSIGCVSAWCYQAR